MARTRTNPEVVVVDAPLGELPRVRRLAVLSRRRVVAGWLLGAAGLGLLTAVLVARHLHIGVSSLLLLYLLVVVLSAAVGGTWPGLASAVASSLLVNWFFTPPFHTFAIKHGQNVFALVVFVVVATTVSALVSTAARRSHEASRARSEAETIARLAGTLLGTDDPIPQLVGLLRSTFGLRAVALLRRASSDWRVESHSGTPCPVSPEQADETVEISPNLCLALLGRKLGKLDRRVLDAFVAQFSAALLNKQLRADAEAAQKAAAANELRTAILAGVSHDLRTPLSSIKASVTSLLQEELEWPAETTTEFLRTIDTEADRLNKIVGNLLDMSRLRTGGLNPTMRSVGLDEVVAGALAGLGERGRGIDIDVPETLATVRADAALLERAVANVVDNALRHTPAGSSIGITADEAGNRVRLHVADNGPGIASSERAKAFEPFQQLGDTDNSTGVGLGLAVARGFVEAMGGLLTLEDTPGGGLTVNIDLERYAA